MANIHSVRTHAQNNNALVSKNYVYCNNTTTSTL